MPNRKRRHPQRPMPEPDLPPEPRKNTKVTGERSEADFQTKAIHRNFGVAKPWGDSRRYDFILDNGLALFRVQVKCTESIRARAYETRATYTTGKGRAVYTKKDIDFIAAHVVPLDIFYIIPVEICTPQPMLRFYPHRQARIMRLEPYREAWNLLEGYDHGCKIEIQASADETVYPEITPNAAIKSDVIPSEARDLGVAPTTDTDSPIEATPIAHHSKPVHLKPGQAPWPTPPLRILAMRRGKRILPEPEE